MKEFKTMGVINVTPDSFFDGGKFLQQESYLFEVESMVEAGVHIVDIGGESTKPFAKPVSLDEELNRVLPVIESVKNKFYAV